MSPKNQNTDRVMPSSAADRAQAKGKVNRLMQQMSPMDVAEVIVKTQRGDDLGGAPPRNADKQQLFDLMRAMPTGDVAEITAAAEVNVHARYDLRSVLDYRGNWPELATRIQVVREHTTQPQPGLDQYLRDAAEQLLLHLPGTQPILEGMVDVVPEPFRGVDVPTLARSYAVGDGPHTVQAVLDAFKLLIKGQFPLAEASDELLFPPGSLVRQARPKRRWKLFRDMLYGHLDELDPQSPGQ